MQKYNDIYKGIIIQTNDPKSLNRVKVFVPHISMTLYEGWNKDLDKDKFFKFPGENLESDLSADILKRLKESLPWGEVMMPVFGAGGSGFFQGEINKGTLHPAPLNPTTVPNNPTPKDDLYVPPPPPPPNPPPPNPPPSESKSDTPAEKITWDSKNKFNQS